MDSDAGKVLALFFVFGGGFWVVAPIARAVAKRIAGGATNAADAATLDELRDELHHVRGELAEMAERLDFAERMLIQQKEGEKLPPGGRG
jgi:hypothetical protein